MQKEEKKKAEEPDDEDRLEKFVSRDFSKNGSNTMMLIIIVVVVIIALGGGGYFYYSRYYNVDPVKKMRKDTSVAATKKPKSPPKSGEKLSFVTEQ